MFTRSLMMVRPIPAPSRTNFIPVPPTYTFERVVDVNIAMVPALLNARIKGLSRKALENSQLFNASSSCWYSAMSPLAASGSVMPPVARRAYSMPRWGFQWLSNRFVVEVLSCVEERSSGLTQLQLRTFRG
jgi:hypothetical protein